MKYSIVNDIRVVEVPTRDFRVVLYDGKKKAMGPNRCNAGFFSTHSEQGVKFTLPVGHLVCDYEATEKWTQHYCNERGKFAGGKFWFDSGSWSYMNPLHRKRVSTLVVSKGQANIVDLTTCPTLCEYAIAGIPVIRGGKAVEYVAAWGQGWDASSLYGTCHIFAGLKSQDANTVYVLAMKTTSGNMLSSKEVYHKLKALGLCDVIKLDGGGSFYFNAAGNTWSTLENRRVCTILDFGQPDGNPYAEPTSPLRRGSGDKTGVCWLQWELTDHGFHCTVDGSFGPATDKALRAYQKANGLVVDGSCGPATRASLLKK